jgi:hypothetical protein
MPENDGSTLNNVQRFKLCDEEAHKERAYISNRLTWYVIRTNQDG